jgi:hypothetical protein
MFKRLLLGAILFLFPVAAQAQEFTCSFESDPGSTQNFCFDGKSTPVIPSGRTITWLPTGGWNGTGGAQITIAACSSDCSTSTNQGNIGWDVNVGGSQPSLGASKFVRFRIKLLSKMGPIGASKFILFGSDDYRSIPKLGLPFDQNGVCQPSNEGNDHYGVFDADTDPTDAFIRATDYGLGGSFTSLASGSGTTIQSNYAMWAPGVSVSVNCAAFIILPYTGVGGVADIKPQNNAAISQSGWVHIQYETISGAQDSAGFKVWANNNTYASPTTQHLNMTNSGGEIQTTGWNGVYAIGGYWGMGSSNDVSFVIDDVEISDTFDSSYYEAAGAGANTVIRLRSILEN